jgi:nickel/cobalt transporter (NiCoT) family protein
VGMFVLTWLAALLIWRFGRIEERWTARLQSRSSQAPDPESGCPGGTAA